MATSSRLVKDVRRKLCDFASYNNVSNNVQRLNDFHHSFFFFFFFFLVILYSLVFVPLFCEMLFVLFFRQNAEAKAASTADPLCENSEVARAHYYYYCKITD